MASPFGSAGGTPCRARVAVPGPAADPDPRLVIVKLEVLPTIGDVAHITGKPGRILVHGLVH